MLHTLSLHSFPQGLRDGAHGFRGEFANFAVVGDDAVDFVFHIADLGVDSGAEAVFYTGQDFVHIQLGNRFIQGIQGLTAAVTIGFIRIEYMAFAWILSCHRKRRITLRNDQSSS